MNTGENNQPGCFFFFCFNKNRAETETNAAEKSQKTASNMPIETKSAVSKKAKAPSITRKPRSTKPIAEAIKSPFLILPLRFLSLIPYQ